MPPKKAQGEVARKTVSVATQSTAKSAEKEGEKERPGDRRREHDQPAPGVEPANNKQRHKQTGIPAPATAAATAVPTAAAARAPKHPVAEVAEVSFRKGWAEWSTSRSSGTRVSRAGCTRKEAEATGVGAQEHRLEVVSERLQGVQRMAQREEGGRRVLGTGAGG